MKILFTSDLHSDLSAYQSFARILHPQDFDIGIIAGDLMDERVSKEELRLMFGFIDDDLLPELPPANETYEETIHRQIRALYRPDGFYIPLSAGPGWDFCPQPRRFFKG